MATNGDKSGGQTRRPRRTAKKKAATTAAKSSAVVEEVVPAKPSWLTGPGGFLSAGSIRHADITAFLRQLIMLLEAGTPIMKSLNTLAERSQRAGVRALVSDIARYVEGGNALWQAFERHPRYFGVVFVNLIKASEASGTLVPVLKQLADYRERREALRKRVQGAMVYPVILVFACLGVVLIISKWVIPSFMEMFDRTGVDVPKFSQRFINTFEFAGQWWWVCLLGLVGLIVLYKLWYVNNPLRRLAADRIKLRIPIIGGILKKNAIVEFTRTLSLLLRSGLSMMATLDLVRSAIHNQAVAQIVQNVRNTVEEGGSMEEPLRDAERIIPGVVTDMLITGEESGSLDNIAEQVANTYEEEVNISVSALGDLLQPVLTIIIGIIVIFLALALFLPMIDMMETLGTSS